MGNQGSRQRPVVPEHRHGYCGSAGGRRISPGWVRRRRYAGRPGLRCSRPRLERVSSRTTTCGGAGVIGWTCSGPSYPAAASRSRCRQLLMPSGCNPTTRYPGNRADRCTRRAVQPGRPGIHRGRRQAGGRRRAGRVRRQLVGNRKLRADDHRQRLQPAAAGDGRRGAQGEFRGNSRSRCGSATRLRPRRCRRRRSSATWGTSWPSTGRTRRLTAP